MCFSKIWKILHSIYKWTPLKINQLLQRRLATALEDLKYSEKEGTFDLIIVNDDIDVARKSLRDFILPFIAQVQEQQKQAIEWTKLKFEVILKRSPGQFIAGQFIPNLFTNFFAS